MTPEELLCLAEILGDRLGLAFGPDAAPSLERKLKKRLTETGSASFAEYVRRLVESDAELTEAAELVTVHETYLMREEGPLRALAHELCRHRPRGPLHIWSAGCATGEEAYSIAIALLDEGVTPSRVRIMGTDLSRPCIRAARKGRYGASSFRVVPDALRRRHFVEQDGELEVSPTLRSMCHFSEMNLLDRDRVALIGQVSAVVCRNVLIYMHERARRSIIDTFAELILPSGLLLLGHSEPPLVDARRDEPRFAFEPLSVLGEHLHRRRALPRQRRSRSHMPAVGSRRGEGR